MLQKKKKPLAISNVKMAELLPTIYERFEFF